MRHVTLISAAAFLAASACSRDSLDDPVELDTGLVAGAVVPETTVHVYKGLPFGAPPVGDLRWREPQPVAPWDGVRDATTYGNVCIQAPGQGRLNIAAMEGSPPLSEDCLYLNVWTPAQRTSERLPVMVYFFGGAFTEGGGSVPLYDGTELAKKGAVVVTMNYRLGAFGFFTHPALTADSSHGFSGNYGILDMLASLEWVQKNIAAFGGDPGNVTIFGQSAGAMAIASLIASPRAAGLFHRAIGQSVMGGGVAPGLTTRAQAEERGLAAATAVGASTAQELRALSADDVAKLRGAGMIIDGWAIPEDPGIVFAEGRQNTVDVIFGANKDEGSFAPSRATPEQFEQQARGRFGDLADDYLAAYPHATAEEAAVASAETFRDQTFWLARRYAEYQRMRGKNGYVYFFTQNPPAAEGQPAFPAAHAAEVPYVFDNVGELPLFPDRSDPTLAGASASDHAVADQVSAYWVNFARTGDPNGPGLPEWPKHEDLDRPASVILDAEPGTESLPSRERLGVFDRQLRQQLQAVGANHSHDAAAVPTPRFEDGLVDFGGNGIWMQPWITDFGAQLVGSTEIPFLPWTKAMYDYNKATLVAYDPQGFCLPPGGPRAMGTPYPSEIIQDRDRGRVVIIFEGGAHVWREIHMDGRPLPDRDELNPTYFGYSVGRYEGDTLVVETTGFNEKTWLNFNGSMHTDELFTIERFSRPNRDTLHYEATIIDPGAYSEPWTVAWDIPWEEDAELAEYICQENNKFLVDLEDEFGNPFFKKAD
jgi:para-nitrobenzyl esterase